MCGEETQLHSGPGTGTHYLTHTTQEISAEPENRHQERRSQCLQSDFWVSKKVIEVWQHLLEKGNYRYKLKEVSLKKRISERSDPAVKNRSSSLTNQQ